MKTFPLKTWLWLACAALLALGAYAAAGPYLTIHAIRDAVRNQDAQALARQVDFPALRSSLKAQLADRIAREAGIGAQDNPFAAFGLSIANGLVGGAVDGLVTPAGLGAMMEGRKVRDRASGVPMRDALADPSLPPRPEPLKDAHTRYESLSRFTATVHDDAGRPLVFVLTRRGLSWQLSDIRLPQ